MLLRLVLEGKREDDEGDAEEEKEEEEDEKAKPFASVEAILATVEEEVVNRSLDETLPLRLTLLKSILLAWSGSLLAPETVEMTRDGCCCCC